MLSLPKVGKAKKAKETGSKSRGNEASASASAVKRTKAVSPTSSKRVLEFVDLDHVEQEMPTADVHWHCKLSFSHEEEQKMCIL